MATRTPNEAFQLRIARHTERLEELVAFYRDGIGLPEFCRFHDHAGYDGVFLAIPGTGAHLELTGILGNQVDHTFIGGWDGADRCVEDAAQQGFWVEGGEQRCGRRVQGAQLTVVLLCSSLS